MSFRNENYDMNFFYPNVFLMVIVSQHILFIQIQQSFCTKTYFPTYFLNENVVSNTVSIWEYVIQHNAFEKMQHSSIREVLDNVFST